MKALLLAAGALWIAGLALVVLAVLRGGATVSLVLIIPVVAGSSAEFLLGVALLIAGFFALFFGVIAGDIVEERTPMGQPRTTSSESSGAGGVVLVGPIPIVFGSWRGISRRRRWLLAVVGAALVIVVWLALAGLLR